MSQTLFFLLALLPLFVVSYNVDINHPLVYTDPEIRGSNYFGYSISLSSKSSRQPASLLVGAPRTSNGEGRVYRCFENGTNNGLCERIDINPSSSPRRTRVPGTVETIEVITRNTGGLGNSMSTGDTTNFAICAPHSLVNTQSLRDGKTYLDDMRGYCYNYNLGNILHRDNDVLKFKDRYPFNFEINSLYGFSVNYATIRGSESVERIIGQPGVNKVEIKHGSRKITKSLDVNVLANLGYAVASGYFFHRNELLFVAGAPGWRSTGEVMIYHTNWLKEITIKGSVLGEYFGASLAVGDFDGDGLDDLAVGAPHWGEVDFGRVYTFYSSRDVSQQNFRAGIRLQGATGNGEFGYTLAAADLDSDGYSDLIVAAPWEKSGVVYIFYGHVDFRREDSAARITQRIEPSDFGLPLQVQRFGFSLSNSVDIDDNGYPDLAIGAYKSGQAFVLRSKPVIETEVKLVSEPSTLTKSTVSFVVKVCVKYHGKKAPDTQELWFEMTADADHKRVKTGIWEVFADWFVRDQSYCTNQTILLKNGIRNFVDPIVINVKHSVKEKDEDKFCSSCPVLSRKASSQSIKPLLVPFNTGCKDGIICNSNLSVTASFGTTRPNNKWVVGSGDVNFNLTVRNDGEPAYVTELTVDIPSGIRLRNAVTSCREDSKENAVTLLCEIGNPLERGETKHLNVTLDMEHVAESVGVTTLIFNVTRRTRSVDHGKDKRTMSFGLTVKHVASLTLTGVTDTKSLHYSRKEIESKIPIRHTYRVVKVGATPITEARLTIDVPVSVIGTNDSFLDITDPKLIDSGGKIYNCLINGFNSEIGRTDWHEDPDSEKLLLRRRRRQSIGNIYGTTDSTVSSEEPQDYDERLNNSVFNASGVNVEEGINTDRTVYLNCSTEGITCVRIICLFSLSKNSENDGNVALDTVIDANAFYTSNEYSLSLRFNTNASVEILRPLISDETSVGNTSATVTTSLYSIAEPQKLAGWIIPTSIVFGILLFCALAVILFKVGFFSRPKKADMAKAKEMELMVKDDGNDDERYG